MEESIKSNDPLFKFKGDIYLLAMTILLIGLGILVVYSSVSARAVSSVKTTESIFIEHLIMLGIGVATMIACYRINYKWYGILALPLLIISLILMVLVSIPGIGKEINQASRWLVLPVVNRSFQPSDLAKVSCLLYTSPSPRDA